MANHATTLLTQHELEQALKLDLAAVTAVEMAFASLNVDAAHSPPRISLPLNELDALLEVRTAYVPQCDYIAVKASPFFFGNAQRGMARSSSITNLISVADGAVEALLIDRGHMRSIRTAAAGAVAAKHLAVDDASTLGVIGTGTQARLQIEAATLVRPIEQVYIWGRDRRAAEQLATTVSDSLSLKVEVVDQRRALIARSQILVTATSATEPVVEANCFHDGLHITAVGSDRAQKNEFTPAALAQVDRYIADHVSQCEKLGELGAARAANILMETPPELGQIIRGQRRGRSTPAQITLCDLTGVAAQDTAIANLALHNARRQGLGARIEH